MMNRILKALRRYDGSRATGKMYRGKMGLNIVTNNRNSRKNIDEKMME